MTPWTISAPPAPPPQRFSSTEGTLQGLLDGANLVFTLPAFLRRTRVFRNGLLMTLNLDCFCAGRAVVFSPQQVPQPDDVLTVEGYLQ